MKTETILHTPITPHCQLQLNKQVTEEPNGTGGTFERTIYRVDLVSTNSGGLLLNTTSDFNASTTAFRHACGVLLGTTELPNPS